MEPADQGAGAEEVSVNLMRDQDGKGASGDLRVAITLILGPDGRVGRR